MKDNQTTQLKDRSLLLGVAIVGAWVVLPLLAIVLSNSPAITTIAIGIYVLGFLALAKHTGGGGLVGFIIVFMIFLLSIAK